jgi:Protein of unknown function (DUF742)
MSPGNDGLIRSFINQPSFARAKEQTEVSAEVPVVRAYMMTGGRTVSDGERLEFETMLSLSPIGKRRQPNFLFEQAKIAALTADEAVSIAEISAKLRVPVGVAQVLCIDMVSEGFLEVHAASSNVSSDVSLLTRLINGVRAL